jgi:predicted TIM-barrel fold metal-dependent hydrolase
LTTPSPHPEPIIDPSRPIIDPHHHLWTRPGSRYLLDELLADINSGHNIIASVFIQCQSMYKAMGPVEKRPVGETEFVNGIAAMSASGAFGPARLCEGIVGYADLMLGSTVEPVLEDHVRAGGGRFRGVRYLLIYDEDEQVRYQGYPIPPHLALDAKFRQGVACLGRMNLSFDAIVLSPQLPEIIALADACPDVTMILNHVGIPLQIGRFKGRTSEVMAQWGLDMKELARRPNVVVKLGGLSLHWVGLGFDRKVAQPSSETLAQAWRPYVETCIEAFGTERCMFQSNFPVDSVSTNYPVLWNAFKRLAQGASENEKNSLFSQTAARAYRLERA